MSSSATTLTLKRAFTGITLGYVFLAALIALIGVVGVKLSRSGTTHTRDLSERLLPALQDLAGLQEATLKYNLANLEYVTGRDEETQARKLADAEKTRKLIDEQAAALSRRLDSPESGQLQQKFGEALRTYDASIAQLRTALKANEFDQAMKLLDGDVAQHNKSLEAALEALRTHVFEISSMNGLATQRILERNLSLTLQISAAIATLGLIGVGFVQWTSRRISRPLQGAVAQMQDFTLRTAEASRQIATSSQSLANGASQQAASLEETSASLEEMSGMTKRNADSAQTAKQIAGQTRSAVEAGVSAMQRMSQAMGGIKASSDEIAKIIKTIDEIAFQTNILALNAAVEAARAGEAGAGFAVVAEEVRALAQRSASAAKETAAKIDTALAKSEEGSRTNAEVSGMLDQIVEQVRRMDTLVAEIAQASSEQREGIGQVNKAVSDMDRITQSNAASAEQSASAAEQLSTQSGQLHDLVENLRVLVGAKTQDAASAPSAAGPALVSPTLPGRKAKAAAATPADASFV